MSNPFDRHPVVSREQWLQARRQHLIHEKALTHHRDQLSAARRELPWVKIDTRYRFSGPNAEQSLAELFGRHTQLIIYHFMFGPDWTEGCKGCSFLSDHLDGANLHLAHHDVSVVAVSHASWEAFQPFKQRMGWQFDWVSSAGSTFNHDFGVSFTQAQIANGDVIYNYEKSPEPFDEMPGLSVFYKNERGEIFHTYSTYARGLDLLVGTYNFLDLTPKGRNEDPIMNWVRHHDRYEHAGPADSGEHCCEQGTAHR
ncbi:thioredoxin [Pseudomonas floridensis]|uniref:Thioredoxin n=1 Tax=Pseudomonas floridensis TaxID=1958950 RepID=A0A1X0NAR3_9PSED|nr:thioredoxin family protein [Pseudomonas floridensis]ORC60935.1 thioredoxin [Pseudomonas floridensis]